jgi:hypothetical protein
MTLKISALFAVTVCAILSHLGTARAVALVPFVEGTVQMPNTGAINIEEEGQSGSKVTFYPSGHLAGTAGPDGPIPNRTGDDNLYKTATIPDGGVLHFTMCPSYTGATCTAFGHVTAKGTYIVTDFTQIIDDPAVLSAAAYVGGVQAPLGDWLLSHGYTSEANSIAEPDFELFNGSPLYFAVDLAELLDAGTRFAASQTFGADFTIGADDSVPGLPGYLFSSTLPVDDPGTGWSVTTVPAGTEIQYVAFHRAFDAIEPGSWLIFSSGSALTVLLTGRRCRSTKTAATPRLS